MDNSELQPIFDFMSKLPPFDLLHEKTLKQCCQSLQITHCRQQEKLINVKMDEPQLYIVRSGAIEVKTKQGALIDRIAEGQYFGFNSIHLGQETNNQIHILENGLLYHLSAKSFDRLRANNHSFDRFFSQAFAKQLRDQESITNHLINTTRVTNIMSHNIIIISQQTSIQQAAKLMSEQKHSSLVVMHEHKICGILTDRDLRNRVLAKGLDSSLPVKKIMTKNPITIKPNVLIFEAMLKMSERNINHLPVVDKDIPIAMITCSDLIHSQGSHPLLLIAQIDQQNNLEDLIQISKQISNLLKKLINNDVKAIEIGRILTSVTDVLTRRLITLKQRQLGPAPMDFCWLAFGSQGRQDQVAGSDQDSALLLAKEATAQEKDYFKKLAEYVCSALNECGFPFCPGNLMAQNPQWQLTLSQWKQQFSNWINTPKQSALINATIFFDMRPIFGAEELFLALQQSILSKTQNNELFITTLTQNTLKSAPALGFFRHAVIERDGTEVKGIDLKFKGNTLINDIVRVYALAAGIEEVNTCKRLDSLLAHNHIDKDMALNLLDAWEFIADLRLANQGHQFNNTQAISNYILPDSLSSLLRHQLKDAFKVIHEAQATIKLKFLN